MKAMILPAFGGPEVFEEQDISKPVPGPSELLVKVHATSLPESPLTALTK